MFGIRQELIIGCILVVIGIGLGFEGYSKTQPTTGDKIVGFFEEATGQRMDSSLKSSKSTAYLMLIGGGIVVLAGLGMILKSQASSKESGGSS